MPYENIEVRVYKSATNESCEMGTGLEILRQTVALQSAHVLLGKQQLQQYNKSAEAVIAYQVSNKNNLLQFQTNNEFVTVFML